MRLRNCRKKALWHFHYRNSLTRISSTRLRCIVAQTSPVIQSG
jgi:hypothetical protein